MKATQKTDTWYYKQNLSLIIELQPQKEKMIITLKKKVFNVECASIKDISTCSHQSFTFDIASVMTSGIGSVVSPIPRLITLASGYFSKCADLLLAICGQ